MWMGALTSGSRARSPTCAKLEIGAAWGRFHQGYRDEGRATRADEFARGREVLEVGCGDRWERGLDVACEHHPIGATHRDLFAQVFHERTELCPHIVTSKGPAQCLRGSVGQVELETRRCEGRLHAARDEDDGDNGKHRRQGHEVDRNLEP